MYPAQPTAIATTPDGFLLVYSDTHIDVFDAAAGTFSYIEIYLSINLFLKFVMPFQEAQDRWRQSERSVLREDHRLAHPQLIVELS